MSERSAIFSLSGGLPPAFAADEDRAAIAQLVNDAGTRDCFVHRIAADGASMTIATPIAHGERARMELPFGVKADGAVVIGDADTLKFQFDQPLDVISALAHSLAAQPAERRQMPRIELRQRLYLRAGGQVEFAWTRDLSPAGLGIETKSPLSPGEVVEVTLDGLRPISGEVRWVKPMGTGGVMMAGIAHDHAIGWQMLMPWLRQISAPRPAASPPIAPDASPLGAVKNALRLNLPSQLREGSSWWNAQVTAISPALVAFECDRIFQPGVSLWLSLPSIGGWPLRVIEHQGRRHIGEFRMPLRPYDMNLLQAAVRGPRGG